MRIVYLKKSLPSQSPTRHESHEALSTPSSSDTSPKRGCIVCKGPPRASTIYCSDACILKHTQDSLVTHDSPTKVADSHEKSESGYRVMVYERKSGRFLGGSNAPTVENLKRWLQKHPTFEVVPPSIVNTIKPNLIKNKQPMDGKETKRIQTTLNSERVPGKLTEINLFIKHPNVEARTLQSHKEEQTQSPQLRTPLQPRQPHQDLRESPHPRTYTAKRVTEPKNSTRTANRSHSISDKRSSVSPSTPRKKESPDTKMRMESIDPIRDNVRKALREQMTIRMKETKRSKWSKKEIKHFATDTESELYELFKDVGMKYKAKYRSLIFNIKDRKNMSLWQKICKRKLTPKQLVRLSPEELASQELAQWREEESKHQLDLIKKSELDLLAASKTYVLKTHKGEEIMQTKESVTTELDSNVPVEDLVTVLNEAMNERTPTDTSKEETDKSESSRSKSSSRKRERDSTTHSKKSSRSSKRKSERRSKSSRREWGTKDKERSTLGDRSPSTERKKSKSDVKEKESKRSRHRSRSRHARRDKTREHSRSGSKDREGSRSSSRDGSKRHRRTRTSED